MKHDSKVCLPDIQEAGGHLWEFTKGVSLEGSKTPICPEGTATVHFGKLKAGAILRFSYWHWRHKDHKFKGAIRVSE